VGSEGELLAWIARRQRSSELVRVPGGDDLAGLAWPGKELLFVGVDQVLDGVHFDSKIHSASDIGRKAMNRNLSDCAAMGCLPAAALATVALPNGIGVEYAKDLYLGIERAAAQFDFPIVGGDTASWDGRLVVTVSIFGRSGSVRHVTRSGAKVGDGIYVSGPLGGSLLGRHMTFHPRVALGRELASGGPTAMIDLSDGLSRDLPRICAASEVGAIIEAADVPIHPDATVLAARDGRSALEHALHDGEDYELLLTSPVERPGLHRIGVITADARILLHDGEGVQPLEPMAWEHSF